MTVDLAYARLSDDEIRHIYKRVYYQAHQPKFLQSFAAAILSTEKREDFMILRPIAVVMIAKYSLGCYLATISENKSA